MSIFDIFKKKQKPEGKKEEKKPEKKIQPEKKLEKRAKAKPVVRKKTPQEASEKEPEAEAEKIKAVKPKRTVKSKVAWKVLSWPHITEKATALSKENQYIFRVAPRSNKIEIKQAIEDVYGVNVEGVRVVNIPAKRRRLGRTRGWKSGYKKAIVKIKKGQEIEVLPR
jgi:large subunit ribosomal protein L23